MDEKRVDEFLDLYKQLEQSLKQVYSGDSGRFESVVVRYANSREGEDCKDELDAIREIRNLLQHNPKINGNYIVTPSDDVMNSLRKIIDDVEHPRLAIDFGVKESQVYKAKLSTDLNRVLQVMKDRGFSQVPIIENNKIYGVLSYYTVFEFVTEQGMQIITDETKVSALKPYLPFDAHKNENYMFMPKTATFAQADEAFEKRDSKRRRLVALFITETGSPSEPMLAMLTPWSVVGK